MRNIGIYLLLLFVLMVPVIQAQSTEKPEGFEQILTRGRIAAITSPQFVTADMAVIDDDSYVLGVVIDGQVKAYSLNLLNSHEVVNDRIGETEFAAVW